MRYWPDPSDTAVRTFSISTGLAASTVTPGNTAPDTSRTTPAMVAWADAVEGISRAIATAATAMTHFLECIPSRSEEHTSELQSRLHLVCRLLLEKKKKK